MAWHLRTFLLQYFYLYSSLYIFAFRGFCFVAWVNRFVTFFFFAVALWYFNSLCSFVKIVKRLAIFSSRPRYPYRGFKYSPTKKVPTPRHYQNWRMRRDLNPRYGSPRIHDFESRAFSLSATHPVYVYHSKIINVSSTVNARFTGCALSRLIGSSILRMAIALSIKCFLYNLQV